MCYCSELPYSPRHLKKTHETKTRTRDDSTSAQIGGDNYRPFFVSISSVAVMIGVERA